jgi:hypothetical protein
MDGQLGKTGGSEIIWSRTGEVGNEEANGCTWLVLPRQEPRQSHIGEYGVKPNIALAGIGIRYLAPANSKCQTNAGRVEVLYSRPCLENKIDRVLCSGM